MFEFDFFKLIIIAMIALLVLGPEKLPGLAAKLGQWAGRARSVARQLRTQLEHEVMMEEVKQTQRKEAEKHPPPAEPSVPAEPPSGPAPSAAESPPQAVHPEFNLDEYARDDFPGSAPSHPPEPEVSPPASPLPATPRVES